MNFIKKEECCFARQNIHFEYAGKGKKKCKRHKYEIEECVFLFLITFSVMLLLYKCLGYAPFGKNSLAYVDANIQYLDLFAYFHDVLLGENSITYTFGKSLGGSNITTFSYYLASPWNLLVVFFEKTELHSYFDLLVAVKLGLASVTMKFFLQERFKEKKFNRTQKTIAVLLAVSYAFGQYNIAQSSNIMWLDGVYMLPLIVLGVYKVCHEKNGILLSVSVGLSILFNWYTGGINCLFAILWWFVEVLLRNLEGTEKWNGKKFFIEIVRYGYAMSMGVCLSAILFLPTIGAMSKNAKGTLDFASLLDPGFMGNLCSAVGAYSLGAKSEYGKVSLFCGSLVLIGCISLFFAKNITIRVKMFFALFMMNIVVLFYWKPFFSLFSLFREATSYWYRYSYVGIFALIFMAAYMYLNFVDQETWIIPIKSAAVFAVILLLQNYAAGTEKEEYIRWTAVCACLMGLVLGMVLFQAKNKNCSAGILLFSMAVLLELTAEVKLEMDHYHVEDTAEFKTYTEQAQKQIEKIQSQDDGIYRITQTATRNRKDESNLTANYNESLAYGYFGIASYLSTTDDVSGNFLKNVGYRREADCMNIVNTSIAAADSLVGTKYILSSYDIAGYEKRSQYGMYNGKYVYENPFALPFTFLFDGKEMQSIETENPFEYQNQIYKNLTGEDTKLYIPVTYTKETDANGGMRYTLEKMNGEYAYYGNIPWNNYVTATIKSGNDMDETAYSCWLSPSVFYISSQGDELCVELSYDDDSSFQFGNEQFYALDLETFAKVSKKLQDNEVDERSVKNGEISIKTTAEKAETLFVSIPYDEGWSVTVNGKAAKWDLVADTFYALKIDEGYNEILMKYHVLYKKEGILISIIGFLGIFGMKFSIKRRESKEKSCHI